MYEEFKEHCIAAYAGYIKDNKELLSCNSGGIATAISVKFIEDGGYVAGVKYTVGFRNAEYYITNKKEDLELFKGSKYIDAQVGDTFSKIKDLLEANEKVFFIGLPCKVGALNFFLKKEYDNLLTCELVCHGPTYTQVQAQFIDLLEKKYNSRVIEFSIRKKMNSWENSYTYAKFENGKCYNKLFNKTIFRKAFNTYYLKRCYNCKFRGNNRTGDFQIGDFWGIDSKKEYYNYQGTSCILVHTNKGLKILKESSNMELFEVAFEDVVKGNGSIISSHPQSEFYDRFDENFKKKGLLYAVRKRYPLKYKFIIFLKKIKRKVKRILLIKR